MEDKLDDEIAGLRSARHRRSGGAEGEEAAADSEDGREAEPLDLPRPWRLLRNPLPGGGGGGGFSVVKASERARRL